MTSTPKLKFVYFLEFQVTTCRHVAIDASSSQEALAAAKAMFASDPSSAAFVSGPSVAHDWVINDRQPL